VLNLYLSLRLLNLKMKARALLNKIKQIQKKPVIVLLTLLVGALVVLIPVLDSSQSIIERTTKSNTQPISVQNYNGNQVNFHNSTLGNVFDGDQNNFYVQPSDSLIK